MTSIEGLLVWSSLALTLLLREDNTRSPSILVAITTFPFAFDDLATIEGLVVLSSLSRGVNAWEDHTSSPSIVAIDITLLLY